MSWLRKLFRKSESSHQPDRKGDGIREAMSHGRGAGHASPENVDVAFSDHKVTITVHGFVQKSPIREIRIPDVTPATGARRFDFVVIRVCPPDAADPVVLSKILRQHNDISDAAVVVMLPEESTGTLDDADGFAPVIESEARRLGVDLVDRDFQMQRGGERGDYDYQLCKFFRD